MLPWVPIGGATLIGGDRLLASATRLTESSAQSAEYNSAIQKDRASTQLTSSLSDFPRECAGSPFGDRFLLFLELILKASALLLSLRYAKRPSGPSG